MAVTGCQQLNQIPIGNTDRHWNLAEVLRKLFKRGGAWRTLLSVGCLGWPKNKRRKGGQAKGRRYFQVMAWPCLKIYLLDSSVVSMPADVDFAGIEGI